MPITDAQNENTDSTPQNHASEEVLANAVVSALKQSGMIAPPAPTGTTEQRVSEFEKVISEFASNPESDQGLVSGLNRAFTAFKKDIQADISARDKESKDTEAVRSLKRSIDSAIGEFAADNPNLREYAPEAREKIISRLVNDPKYAADLAHFNRHGYVEPGTLRKLAGEESKRFPKGDAPAGRTNSGHEKPSLSEQAAMASEANRSKTDFVEEPSDIADRDKHRAALSVFQRSGRLKGKDNNLTNAAVEFLKRKGEAVEKGKEKVRTWIAAGRPRLA